MATQGEQSLQGRLRYRAVELSVRHLPNISTAQAASDRAVLLAEGTLLSSDGFFFSCLSVGQGDVFSMIHSTIKKASLPPCYSGASRVSRPRGGVTKHEFYPARERQLSPWPAPPGSQIDWDPISYVGPQGTLSAYEQGIFLGHS